MEKTLNQLVEVDALGPVGAGPADDYCRHINVAVLCDERRGGIILLLQLHGDLLAVPPFGSQ